MTHCQRCPPPLFIGLHPGRRIGLAGSGLEIAVSDPGLEKRRRPVT